MTSDVIEEAARALYDMDSGTTSDTVWASLPPATKDLARAEARVAFAVFEKVHAVTDDEREALITDLIAEAEHYTTPRAVAVLHRRAARMLRRSEVPEPQGVTIPAHLNKRDTLGPAIRRLLVDEARAENTRREGEQAREIRNAVALNREPQGEPTAAQVKAALDAYVGGDFFALYPASVPYWEPNMRAALRAAGEVRP